ncbi:hypothetical protein CISIN_1g002276mg [Citrus sinensis]|uniref:Kinesin motor domain-containing protein n=1 Tax=Citrus sinensis TaxID=2711 RepID=A0A067DN16_CITSI|nr:hypothetical protein CISIN_1g002276mg [Citrus sinensis]
MEEDQNHHHHQWADPLLLTDVSLQQRISHQYNSQNQIASPPRSHFVAMADSVFHHDPDDGTSWQNDPISNELVDGKSMLGFSLTSPDLVICGGSPEIPKSSYGESPEFSERIQCSFEVSLENGIKGSDDNNGSHKNKTPSVRFSSFNKEFSPESSLELLPPSTMPEQDPVPVVSINEDYREPMLLEAKRFSQLEECESTKDSGERGVKGDYERLKMSYECQKKELTEAKRTLEELKRENQLKNKEYQETWKSLQELQNELMRKSMHVGSLAFAIEGQVKEKSRWFSSLRDLTRRLKIMKMEHINLFEEALAYKKCAAEISEASSTIQSKINHQVQLYEHLKIKFIEGTKERKELYNKVLELKGNIRVFCRCRPLNSEETAAGSVMAVDFESVRDGELTVISNGAPKKTFKFDAVFGPQADQVDVFQDTAPFANSVLDGYNVCIFAYGQTGTGKTFTMEGTKEARGVNFRTLEELFRIIKEREKLYRYDISVSVLEVYNEQIRDLLAVGSQPGAVSKRLEVRQAGEGMHHVPGLVEAHVNNISEVWEVLQTGSNVRAVGSTNANEHSSRSHCMHCVMVRRELVEWGMHKEQAMASGSSRKNSKLTHLLQDSLGGDSKTLMFVQISPNENDLSETLCSLNFASRVRGIELGAAKKQLDTSELLRYKQMVEKTKQELKSRDVQSKRMEDTIHGLDLKLKDKDLKIKSLQDKVKELETQLLVERKLARQHVDTKIAEQHLKQQQQEELKYCTIEATTWKSFAIKVISPIEKENNPEMTEQPRLPNRTGRASLCTAVRRIPLTSAPRRNSLIPLPSAPTSAPLTPALLPLPPCEVDEKEEIDECLTEQVIHCNSPKVIKSESKKLSSALRRSLQKKMQRKSPMQQHFRRGGVNVGMQQLRVSIGSRGRMAHRVLLGAGRRGGTKEIHQKQNQKEKERGWNIGTAGRII